MAVGWSAAAAAQTSMDDPLDDHSAKRLDRMEKVVRELRAIVFQGRDTGHPIVVQPADTSAQIGALNDKLQDLAQSQAKLTGEMEVVRHDLDQSRQEAADLRAQNAALKEQLAAMQEKQREAPAVPAPAAPETAPPLSSVDPVSAFAEARRRYETGDVAGAERAFSDYLSVFGETPKAPEAHYYLAKTLIARQSWPDAATADIAALRGWPRSAWAPDALIDLSSALFALNRPKEACQSLSELGRRYPAAPAGAKAAAARLARDGQCA